MHWLAFLVSQCGKDEMKLRDVIDQLNRCNFECEAGPLRLNTAFIDLSRSCETCQNRSVPSADGLVASPRCAVCVRNPRLNDFYQANAGRKPARR
jgi:hypothetical protein